MKDKEILYFFTASYRELIALDNRGFIVVVRLCYRDTQKPQKFVITG